MWGRRNRTDVTCIACGESFDRREAREYDKYGDRWDRRDKEFEHLCKPCHRELCHQPRQWLEAHLVEIEGGTLSARRFVDRYYEALEDGSETEERGEHGHDS